jgi:hypothetical protein
MAAIQTDEMPLQYEQPGHPFLVLICCAPEKFKSFTQSFNDNLGFRVLPLTSQHGAQPAPPPAACTTYAF